MASTNGKDKLTSYEQIVIDDMRKKMATPIYCELCGKEIFRTTENVNTIEKERKLRVHNNCLLNNQREQQELYLKKLKEDQNKES
jgi:hypothetical protein